MAKEKEYAIDNEYKYIPLYNKKSFIKEFRNLLIVQLGQIIEATEDPYVWIAYRSPYNKGSEEDIYGLLDWQELLGG